MKKPLKVYLISLGAVLLASVYPIYMGGVMMQAYILNGGIDVANYPKYIIPYTPICIALIICAALLPLAWKLCKKYTLPAISALGVLLFLGVETGFEKIAVFADLSTKMDVRVWQMLSCVMTPIVKTTLWDSLSIRYNSAFKIHFYSIALLIILSVLGVIYGFYKMSHNQNYKKKKPLILQLTSVLIFIGLCIFACFTTFFRTGEIIISPISAVLMTVFFLVFGITAGVYAGTWLYGKRKLFSFIIPSIVAVIVTIAMYIGEMVMMNWNLYRFGKGIIFDPIGACPLASVDMLIIVMSGVITYFTLFLIRAKTTS